MASSNLSYQVWLTAIYIAVTGIKGTASTKLASDLGITQKSAWHLGQRLRKAWEENPVPFVGPVEVDETYIGGRERNKHKKDKLHAGRGVVGKSVVVGAKDRKTKSVQVKSVNDASKPTLHTFIQDRVEKGAKVYTDDALAYQGMGDYDHESVRHSAGEYVRDQAHTNGIESFWSLLKRGYIGTHHWWSRKHLSRYVNEFAGRQGVRSQDTIGQMQRVANGMVGRHLTYQELIQ